MSQSLCLSCGLCCDGSLFWAVPVEDGAPDVVPRDDQDMLRQPCARFDGACTIYANRPAGCRDFNCHVLDAVAAGAQDRKWGLAQIADMRRVLADLDQAVPGREPSLYRRVAEFLAAHQDQIDTPAFRAENGAVLNQIARYEQALAGFRTLGNEIDNDA